MEMKTVDVHKLDGLALDWAVAVACEMDVSLEAGYPVTPQAKNWPKLIFDPSTDWGRLGPLLEKQCIELLIGEDDYLARRTMTNPYESKPVWAGHTMLVAACRAIVGTKLGYLIEVPAELLNQP